MEAEVVAEATDKVVWEEVFLEDRCTEEVVMVDIKIIGMADEEVDHLWQEGVKAQVMKNTKIVN